MKNLTNYYAKILRKSNAKNFFRTFLSLFLIVLVMASDILILAANNEEFLIQRPIECYFETERDLQVAEDSLDDYEAEVTLSKDAKEGLYAMSVMVQNDDTHEYAEYELVDFEPFFIASYGTLDMYMKPLEGAEWIEVYVNGSIIKLNNGYDDLNTGVNVKTRFKVGEDLSLNEWSNLKLDLSQIENTECESITIRTNMGSEWLYDKILTSNAVKRSIDLNTMLNDDTELEDGKDLKFKKSGNYYITNSSVLISSNDYVIPEGNDILNITIDTLNDETENINLGIKNYNTKTSYSNNLISPNGEYVIGIGSNKLYKTGVMTLDTTLVTTFGNSIEYANFIGDTEELIVVTSNSSAYAFYKLNMEIGEATTLFSASANSGNNSMEVLYSSPQGTIVYKTLKTDYTIYYAKDEWREKYTYNLPSEPIVTSDKTYLYYIGINEHDSELKQLIKVTLEDGMITDEKEVIFESKDLSETVKMDFHEENLFSGKYIYNIETNAIKVGMLEDRTITKFLDNNILLAGRRVYGYKDDVVVDLNLPNDAGYSRVYNGKSYDINTAATHILYTAKIANTNSSVVADMSNYNYGLTENNYLLSFDNKNTWFTYKDGNWKKICDGLPEEKDIGVHGMTKDEVNNLVEEDFEKLTGLTVIRSIDIALHMFTPIERTKTPVIRKISYSLEEKTTTPNKITGDKEKTLYLFKEMEIDAKDYRKILKIYPIEYGNKEYEFMYYIKSNNMIHYYDGTKWVADNDGKIEDMLYNLKKNWNTLSKTAMSKKDLMSIPQNALTDKLVGKNFSIIYFMRAKDEEIDSYSVKFNIDYTKPFFKSSSLVLVINQANGEVRDINGLTKDQIEDFVEWLVRREKGVGPIFYMIKNESKTIFVNYYMIQNIAVTEEEAEETTYTDETGTTTFEPGDVQNDDDTDDNEELDTNGEGTGEENSEGSSDDEEEDSNPIEGEDDETGEDNSDDSGESDDNENLE